MWIKPITINDLIAMVRSFPLQFPNISPRSEAIQYSLAATVLRTYLRDQWCDRNITCDSNADPHLTQKNSAAENRMKIQSRIVALAEMIFNLQHALGADVRIARLTGDSLESSVAELEAARLLLLNDISFNFVLERMKKKFDYDIEIIVEKDLTLCCEAKCKIEMTPLSENSLQNSLKKAIKQLPSTKPCLIFIKLPESWITNPDFKNIVDKVLATFFRNNKRIVEVIFHWEEWQILESGSLLRLTKYKEIENRESRFYDTRFVHLLRELGPIHVRSKWCTFRHIISEA